MSPSLCSQLNTLRQVSSFQNQWLPVLRICTITTPSRGLRRFYYQRTSNSSPVINTRVSRHSSLPRLVATQKTTTRLVRTTTGWSPQLGSEPGLDSSTYAANEGPASQLNDKEETIITILDYSSKNTFRHEVDPASFNAFLNDNPKPDWASCRWIYVNGIDQNILRSLGSNFNLHRLALEDVLESRGPVKADWYDGHLFVALPLHKLLPPVTLEEEVAEQGHKLGYHHREHQHRRDWRTIAHQKFNVAVEQASIFWTNSDTVITIFQRSGNDVLKPVLNRLDSPNSILRSADDPSMLIQAVIDVAVDLCMPIEKAFADEFAEMELIVLSNPAIQQSRSLYILRSRLTLLLDNFIAVNSLLRKLCGDHPLTSNPMATPKFSGGLEPNPRFETSSSSVQALRSVTISPTTQLYLRDVLDHVHTLSASTDVAIRSTENLTSLIFNTIAASQNESVRQLTVISSFFLPLTFLTGYMGMNFEKMSIVQQHSDLVFWAIAAPAMITMGIFMRVRARKKLKSSGSWMSWVRRSRTKSN